MKKILSAIFILFLFFGSLAGAATDEDKTSSSAASPNINTLIKDLQGAERGPQLRAKATLIGMGQKAGPDLLKALDSASSGLSLDLVEILAITRYQESAARIEKIWQATKNSKLKLAAAEALCRFNHNYARYQGYILSQTREGELDHRLQAMQMLGYIRDKRVIEPLVSIFQDPTQSDQIRQAAIWDLAHTPVKESAEALVNMVNDPEVDWFYKEIIISAIRRLAGQTDMAPIISKLLEKSQNIPASSGKGIK
ncbi:MAG: HEAT repeat domain-containing protein [Candidatus Euphemobacter frigidus]|nr:HEAT repeat domain-containing protein [Candidatus Euphemobacter frigidus]